MHLADIHYTIIGFNGFIKTPTEMTLITAYAAEFKAVCSIPVAVAVFQYEANARVES